MANRANVQTLTDVYRFLKRNGPSTIDEIAKGCDMSYSTAKRRIEALCEEGNVMQVRHWEPYRYEVYRGNH